MRRQVIEDIGEVDTTDTNDICPQEDSGLLNHANSYMDHFTKLWKDTDLSDITFIVQNTKINAHRLILCTSSDVFKVMLLGNFQEGHQQVVPIQDPLITAPIFKDFLKYIYTKEIQLTAHNCFPLHYLADQYNFPLLFNSTLGYMKKCITPANCLEIYQETKRWSTGDVGRVAMGTFQDRTREALPGLEAVEDIGVVLEIVRCERLNVTETELFVSLAKWMGSPAGKKCEDIKKIEVMREVRYGL